MPPRSVQETKSSPERATPAAGFRYTPSSYLHRTAEKQQNIHKPSTKPITTVLKKVENRPWTHAADNNDNANPMIRNSGDSSHSSSGDGYEMKQEDRPSRRQSNLDAHFQSRIARRKDLYRGIIQGKYDFDSTDSGADADAGNITERDELEHSWGLVNSSEEEQSRASSSEQARMARQQRRSRQLELLVVDDPQQQHSSVALSSSSRWDADSEAARVRHLRAERLRTAKKPSSQEDDLEEKLRHRRALQREQERKAQEQQQETAEQQRQFDEDEWYWLEQQRLDRERAALAEERRLWEAAQRDVARLAAEDQELGRPRSRTTTSTTQKRMPRTRIPFGRSSSSSSVSHRAVAQEHEDASSTTFYSPSLFDEMGLLLRESGILKACVEGCFGDHGHVLDEPATTSTTTTSSHLEEDLLDEDSF